uniref:Microtubule-associated proteins 1A/1B light chain 3A n=1 Tax=Rhabditophanes sp. KR3021 TaxID=114890 RepID=A0AC35U515_9BILA
MSLPGYAPTFKERKTHEFRVKSAIEIRQQHPDKIPVIIERYETERYLPLIDRCKFLVPNHITIADLMQIIRRRLNLHPEQSFFLMANERSIVSVSTPLDVVYRNEADIDGFLYIVYTSQQAFG